MKEIIKSLYIEPLCSGDIIHNKYIDILVKDIAENEFNKIVISEFKGNWKTGHWIFCIYTKDELRRFNVIMRTKVEKTKIKRMANLLNQFCRGTHWHALFNKYKINTWTEIFYDYAVKHNEEIFDKSLNEYLTKGE